MDVDIDVDDKLSIFIISAVDEMVYNMCGLWNHNLIYNDFIFTNCGEESSLIYQVCFIAKVS